MRSPASLISMDKKLKGTSEMIILMADIWRQLVDNHLNRLYSSYHSTA